MEKRIKLTLEETNATIHALNKRFNEVNTTVENLERVAEATKEEETRKALFDSIEYYKEQGSQISNAIAKLKE